MVSRAILEAVNHADDFDWEMRELAARLHYPTDPKTVLAYQLSLLSLNHGVAIRSLFAAGHFPSALVLIRSQLEKHVRSEWVRHVAEKEWIELFTSPANVTATRPAKFKSISILLDALDLKFGGDHGATYREIKLGSMPLLHSFSHGGVEAINLTVGISDADAIQYLRTSVCLSFVVAANVMSLATDSEPSKLQAIRQKYDHCIS